MSNYNKDEINKKIISHLKHVFDPEIPVNVYDLGLIYEINLEEKQRSLICNIIMTLTSPGCPVAESLVAEVTYAAKSVDEVDEANVELTFSPQWDQSKVTQEGKELMLVYGFNI